MQDRAIACEANIEVKTGHAGRLLAIIDDVIKKAGADRQAIDLIAVGIGPGSFTGIRIGIATAKGLSTALGCGISGINTLDALAHGAIPSNIPIMPIIDARKSEVFCALYSPEGIPVTHYMNIRPERIRDYISSDTLFIGNGLDLYKDDLQKDLEGLFFVGPKDLWNPRASTIGLMASNTLHQAPCTDVNPVYVRPSDATLTLNRSLKKG